MFVTAPYNKLFALDARNGRLIWKYERQLPDDVVTCCDVVNRGVALYGDKVYMGTLDAHLIAFDARTGKIV
ncbi:PQQ-binding-like beta-propeller repeat protein, partial [Klebsiella pneumoniae]|uniref:outer membrane protein assembly factor BamB family protein n=1 Tax=Klebsiella pneumoniae TaxID=573 RepID=UPI003B59CD5F